MPVNDYHPDFALSSSFDASAWASLDLFERNGTATTAPSTAGQYASPMHMLCGMGVDPLQTFDARLKVLYGAGWSLELLSTDRLRIRNTGAIFQLDASANNATYGFPVGDTSAVADGSDWIIDATGDWSRDMVTGVDMVMSQLGVPGANFPKAHAATHGVGLLLRERGAVGDADDITDCLEKWDNDAHDNTSRRIRWGVNKAGHVYCSYQSTATVDPIDTWTTFTRRLGFSGNESVVTADGAKTMTADYPLPGFLVPSRGITKLEATPHEVSHSIRLNSGRGYGNSVALHQDWALQFYLDGPGDDVPLATHWRNQCLPYLSARSGVVLYQALGEWRRVLYTADVTDTQPAYDETYTSELDGRRGALMLQMAEGNGLAIRWPGRLRRRIPITLNLEYRGDG